MRAANRDQPTGLNGLFAERRSSRAWGIIVPAAIAGMWALHEWQDHGFMTALPYAAVVALCGLYFTRPMWIVWGAVFAAFAGYTIYVIARRSGAPPRMLAGYLFHGVAPLLLLWFARPKEDAAQRLARYTDQGAR